MSNWSSFEKDKIATDAWRSYLNERYSDQIRASTGAITTPLAQPDEEEDEEHTDAEEETPETSEAIHYFDAGYEDGESQSLEKLPTIIEEEEEKINRGEGLGFFPETGTSLDYIPDDATNDQKENFKEYVRGLKEALADRLADKVEGEPVGLLASIFPSEATEEGIISKLAHIALDLGGFDFFWLWTGPAAPFIGASFDTIHGIWYVNQGKYFKSLISFTCAVLGAATLGGADFLKLIKWAKEAKLARGVIGEYSTILTLGGEMPQIYKLARTGDLTDGDARILIAMNNAFKSEKGQKLLNTIMGVLKEERASGFRKSLEELDKTAAELSRENPHLLRSPTPKSTSEFDPTTDESLKRDMNTFLTESEIKKWQTIAGIKKRAA